MKSAALAALAFAAITGLAPHPAAAGSTVAARGRDATAVVQHDGFDAARGTFRNYGDRFELTKLSNYGGRPYLDYKYVRIDGTEQEGRHWGVADVGTIVPFDHNFGEGRKVRFRVCVDVWGFDPCSGWVAGIA